MSELIRVSGCENTKRPGDVIFVHGLNGNPREYWQYDKSGWQGDVPPDSFWPKWLGEDLQAEGIKVGVWSLGYDAAPSAWVGHTMPLPQRATNCLDKLKVTRIGGKPIVFVTHSMGGLVVKQMILMASRSPDQRWRDIAVRTRGICFIATPHTGAAAASWVNYLKVLLRTSASVADLEAHNPHLMQLNTEFRRYVDETSLAISVYCETRETSGVMVVPAGTADPGLSKTEAVYLDDDHLSICKPRSRTSQLYEGIRLFVEDCFAGESPANP
jgi:hypothetical protein